MIRTRMDSLGHKAHGASFVGMCSFHRETRLRILGDSGGGWLLIEEQRVTRLFDQAIRQHSFPSVEGDRPV